MAYGHIVTLQGDEFDSMLDYAEGDAGIHWSDALDYLRPYDYGDEPTHALQAIPGTTHANRVEDSGYVMILDRVAGYATLYVEV